MIDATNFLQSSGAITEVEMEEAEPSHEDAAVDAGEVKMSIYAKGLDHFK